MNETKEHFWTDEVDNKVFEYLACTDDVLRNNIYTDFLHGPVTGLSVFVVRRKSCRKKEYEVLELIQECSSNAVECFKTFDRSRGTQLWHYLVGATYNYVSNDNLSRRKAASKLDYIEEKKPDEDNTTWDFSTVMFEPKPKLLTNQETLATTLSASLCDTTFLEETQKLCDEYTNPYGFTKKDWLLVRHNGMKWVIDSFQSDIVNVYHINATIRILSIVLAERFTGVAPELRLTDSMGRKKTRVKEYDSTIPTEDRQNLTRLCPVCSKELKYLTVYERMKAEQKNGPCLCCSRKKSALIREEKKRQQRLVCC